MSARQIQYRGVTKSGRRHSGVAMVDDLPAWIEKKWKAGWRYLLCEENGEEVGGIAVLKGGVWWSER